MEVSEIFDIVRFVVKVIVVVASLFAAFGLETGLVIGHLFLKVVVIYLFQGSLLKVVVVHGLANGQVGDAFEVVFGGGHILTVRLELLEPSSVVSLFHEPVVRDYMCGRDDHIGGSSAI